MTAEFANSIVLWRHPDKELFFRKWGKISVLGVYASLCELMERIVTIPLSGKNALRPGALGMGAALDCVRQAGVNWEAVISTVGQVVVSAARAASSLAAMPAIVSNVK